MKHMKESFSLGNKDWQKAIDKLNFIMKNQSEIDPYVLFNIVAPLRKRLYNGDRSMHLYGEILRLQVNTMLKDNGK
jgi:hypothetical protein